MNAQFIHTDKGRIHFLSWGQGDRLIIAFPGFSNSAALFEPIGTALQEQCTVVALDLPFHGRTQWQAEQYTRADVQDWIQAILTQFQKNHFEWMGFSLGGRIILSMVEFFPQELRAIHLIAPDGLATYRTFYPSLVPQFVRRGLLQSISRHPEKWLRLAQRLHDWRLLDHFSLIYIEKQLRTSIQTDRLFKTWLSLPNFPVSARHSRRILLQRKLPFSLSLGRRDKFIHTAAIRKWAKPIPHTQLHLFDQGHQLVNQELGVYFQQLLNED
ncbi:MAG: alpha/beta hydrolase [Saprospiraceae bacterium]|nr:alpha/beta hydrolase [Saprospiraceae bacterium]